MKVEIFATTVFKFESLFSPCKLFYAITIVCAITVWDDPGCRKFESGNNLNSKICLDKASTVSERFSSRG